jgi:hypothetical protein
MFDSIWKPTGVVTVRLTRADGSLITEQVQPNTFTLAGATRLAAKLAGEAGTITCTDIQSSSGGTRIYDFDSTAGFSGTATLETTIYRQGAGAFKIEAAPSGTQYVFDATTVTSSTAVTGSSIEVSLRFTTLANVNKSSTELRIFTGGTSSNYYGISVTSIESALGAFADATWKICRIPISSFNITGGAPSFNAVTGIGLNLVAGTAGTATAYIDNAFVVNGNNDITAAASSVPAVYDTQPVTASRVTRTVTSVATWGLNTAVGETFYIFGLRDHGTNLLAITGYGAGSGIYKEPNSILTVSWALTTTA